MQIITAKCVTATIFILQELLQQQARYIQMMPQQIQKQKKSFFSFTLELTNRNLKDKI